MKLKECFKRGLLRKEQFPEEIGKQEVSNAIRHLKNAEKCLQEGMYDLSVVSIYTSMFHAARAILFRDGIKERSHICVISYIKNHYA